MQFRELGRTGCQVSILSFGCMRLPVQDPSGCATDFFNPNKPIDEAEAVRMIHDAFDQGVNYFDTAYGYHSGMSELVLGRAIKGFRDRVFLATKLPVWLVNAPADFDRLLDEQLQRLAVYDLDFYLLHNLGQQNWSWLKAMGMIDFLDRIRRDGRVHHVGFSFHDDLKTFKSILEDYSWDICQIQYNYLDEEFQAGREGLHFAVNRGVGVVVMEPMRGGKLTKGIPAEVQALWETAPIRRTPAEWALRWVWNHPEVSTALSGMSDLDQLKENLALADLVTAPALSGEEIKLVAQVAAVYHGMLQVPCTTCGYCMPCPSGVNIPFIFSLYNDALLFKEPELSRAVYNRVLSREQQAISCLECGQCEPLCPQHIKIAQELKNVHRHLGG